MLKISIYMQSDRPPIGFTSIRIEHQDPLIPLAFLDYLLQRNIKSNSLVLFPCFLVRQNHPTTRRHDVAVWSLKISCP